MKEYTIINNEKGNWCMDGYEEDFLYPHLEFIAKENAIDVSNACSESHMLAILKFNGVVVELTEPDGSPCEW